MTRQNHPPVFIVGLPRTGSKLLMNVVMNNTFAGYNIANEVQFFGHSALGRWIQGRRGVMDIVRRETDASGNIHWEKVVDRLYSGHVKGVHWNGLTHGWLPVPREVLLERLRRTDGSAKAIYEVVLTTQEKEYNAYGDKSGPNLYFVDELIDWFPQGKVLHIIRDPRAILTSQHKRLIGKLEHKSRSSSMLTRLKKALYSPIIALYVLTYWGYAMRVDRRHRKLHPDNYLLVQYEELTLRPEEATKRICAFLGIPWDPQMISPPKRDSSYIDPSDIKKVVDRGTGMDREATDRWRKHIRPWMMTAVRLYGGLFYRAELQRFGYVEGVGVPPSMTSSPSAH